MLCPVTRHGTHQHHNRHALRGHAPAAVPRVELHFEFACHWLSLWPAVCPSQLCCITALYMKWFGFAQKMRVQNPRAAHNADALFPWSQPAAAGGQDVAGANQRTFNVSTMTAFAALSKSACPAEDAHASSVADIESRRTMRAQACSCRRRSCT